MFDKLAKYLRLAAWIVLAAALLGGCASQQPRTPKGVMDNPVHHFNNGLALLDQGQFERADVEFLSASSMGEVYAPALAGRGVAAAMRGGEDAVDTALDLVDEGRDAAADAPGDAAPAVRMWPEVMEIRALTELYKGGYLERADFLEALEDPYEDAVDYAPRASEPPFYLAEAHVAALDFMPAEGLYETVVERGGAYAERARERWRLVQDVNRIAPGTVAGKRIALVRELTRADMAALLAEELDVDKFYGRTAEIGGTAFAAPGEGVAIDPSRAVADMAGHPLALDVEKVLRYGVRGMGLYPDRTFRPDEPVTRAEAAMIFEDVIVRATGKAELGTQFIGETSHLPDMRGDHPAFNAAMLCISRGVMEADLRSGAFRPLDAVSGIEALAAVKALKRDLSLF